MIEQHKSIRELSVEEWCKLAKEGASVPIVTKLHGISMEPLIRREKDLVRIVPVLEKETLVLGDIVLFERQDGAYVVHRIYKMDFEGGEIQTWGDNCVYPDQPIPQSSVYGFVVSRGRKGRWISLSTEQQRRKGLRWLESRFRRPLWMFCAKWKRKFRSLLSMVNQWRKKRLTKAQ